MVLHLTFRFLIHFEFIFIYGMRECSNLIVLVVEVQFSQHHLLKWQSFVLYIVFPPWSKLKWKLLSHVWLSATPRTVACQAPLSVEFSRPEYRSGLPFPPPRNLLHPEIEPRSPALQADSLLSESPGKPIIQKVTPAFFCQIYIFKIIFCYIHRVICTLLIMQTEFRLWKYGFNSNR